MQSAGVCLPITVVTVQSVLKQLVQIVKVITLKAALMISRIGPASDVALGW